MSDNKKQVVRKDAAWHELPVGGIILLAELPRNLKQVIGELLDRSMIGKNV